MAMFLWLLTPAGPFQKILKLMWIQFTVLGLHQVIIYTRFTVTVIFCVLIGECCVYSCVQGLPVRQTIAIKNFPCFCYHCSWFWLWRWTLRCTFCCKQYNCSSRHSNYRRPEFRRSGILFGAIVIAITHNEFNTSTGPIGQVGKCATSQNFHSKCDYSWLSQHHHRGGGRNDSNTEHLI